MTTRHLTSQEYSRFAAARRAVDNEVVVDGLDRTDPDTLATILTEVALRDFGDPQEQLFYMARFTDGTWIRVRHVCDWGGWSWDVTFTDPLVDPWEGQHMQWRQGMDTPDATAYITHHLTRALERP